MIGAPKRYEIVWTVAKGLGLRLPPTSVAEYEDHVHVCHVNMNNEFGGGERQTLALVQALSGSVSQRVVVRRNSLLHQALALECCDAGIIAGAHSALDALRHTARTDIVHVHEGRSVPVGAARSALGTPFLATHRLVQQPKGRAATRWCYRRAKSIVGVSSAVVEAMSHYTDQRVSDVVYDCAPNLQPPDRGRVAHLRRCLPDKILIGQVGRLDDAMKGQRLTIAVAKLLEHARPEIAFLIIGGGPDDAVLREEAKGISNVWFTGWVPRIADYYAVLDIMAFPSRVEGLGSAILEAMSLGVPSVASAVGGTPEIVEHESNGLLFPKDDIRVFREQLERLVVDAALRNSLARRARDTAAVFSPARMAERYRNLYAEIIRSDRSNPRGEVRQRR